MTRIKEISIYIFALFVMILLLNNFTYVSAVSNDNTFS